MSLTPFTPSTDCQGKCLLRRTLKLIDRYLLGSVGQGRRYEIGYHLRAVVVVILRDVQGIVIVVLGFIVLLDFSFHLLFLGEAKFEQL